MKSLMIDRILELASTREDARWRPVYEAILTLIPRSNVRLKDVAEGIRLRDPIVVKALQDLPDDRLLSLFETVIRQRYTQM